MRLVRIPYSKLVSQDCSADLLNAFRDGGLGAIAISDVPGFAEGRQKLLPLSYTLAHKPASELAELEHEKSMYNAGWSKGKEKIGDKPDELKGSFYANPIHDKVGTFADYPFFFPDNIWPTKIVPELESNFKSLGTIMYETVLLLAKQIDSFCESKIPNYERATLHRELSTSKKVKGRLLYYYPPPADEVTTNDWIGWHNDSGFLTALTSAMYFSEETGQLVPNPDPNGGLYVVDRASVETKVDIRPDDLVVQCGECLQILTGGLLVATPHAVRPSLGKNGEKIGRATFPVFVDSNPVFRLRPPPGIDRAAVLSAAVSSKVPPLEARWKDDMTFVDFLGTTFEQYYAWETRK